MFIHSNSFLLFLIVSYAFYGLFVVPFFCSKSLVRFGETERFWYIIIALLNVYVLLYVLIRSKYRSMLLMKEKFLFVSFIIGYFFFLVPIWKLMDVT